MCILITDSAGISSQAGHRAAAGTRWRPTATHGQPPPELAQAVGCGSSARRLASIESTQRLLSSATARRDKTWLSFGSALMVAPFGLPASSVSRRVFVAKGKGTGGVSQGFVGFALPRQRAPTTHVSSMSR